MLIRDFHIFSSFLEFTTSPQTLASPKSPEWRPPAPKTIKVPARPAAPPGHPLKPLSPTVSTASASASATKCVTPHWPLVPLEGF